jgi:MFS family permease
MSSYEQAEFTLTFLSKASIWEHAADKQPMTCLALRTVRTECFCHVSQLAMEKLITVIGVLSSLLQGGHVRPSLAKLGELTVSRRGIISCTLALGLLAYLPAATPTFATLVLYHAAAGLAYTSATVVTGLTASAASCCDEASRGRALGSFRSKGQLGRAIGPLLATSVYWLYGPTICYSVAAVSMACIAAAMSPLIASERRRKAGKTD